MLITYIYEPDTSKHLLIIDVIFSLTAYKNEYKKIGSTFGSLSAAFAVDVDSESKCLLFVVAK